MTPQYDPSDGLTQLSELMRDERAYNGPGDPEPVDPEVRRRSRRRRSIRGGIAALVVLALLGGYAGFTLTAPIGVADMVTQAPQAASATAAEIALSPEGASAVSISGADEYLGEDASGIWMSKGADKRRPIASISKLITAMVILEAKPLKNADSAGPTLTFDEADNDLYDKYYVLGATIASMPIGSSVSERDALETMLIVSASNYAEAITTGRSDRRAPSSQRPRNGSPPTS